MSLRDTTCGDVLDGRAPPTKTSLIALECQPHRAGVHLHGVVEGGHALHGQGVDAGAVVEEQLHGREEEPGNVEPSVPQVVEKKVNGQECVAVASPEGGKAYCPIMKESSSPWKLLPTHPCLFWIREISQFLP